MRIEKYVRRDASRRRNCEPDTPQPTVQHFHWKHLESPICVGSSFSKFFDLNFEVPIPLYIYISIFNFQNSAKTSKLENRKIVNQTLHSQLSNISVGYTWNYQYVLV